MEFRELRTFAERSGYLPQQGAAADASANLGAEEGGSMISVITLVAVLLAGLSLGTFFFGGLLWTVGKGISAKYPALWFFGSWLVRSAVVLVGFYFVSAGRWERLVVCVAGFVIARMVLIQFSSMTVKQSRPKRKVGDAR